VLRQKEKWFYQMPQFSIEAPTGIGRDVPWRTRKIVTNPDEGAMTTLVEAEDVGIYQR
jgi:hypothetical protein